MGKIIVWIIVIFVILFALRMWNAAQARKRAGPRRAGADAQLMVRCIRCGTFLPKADATASPEGFRCTDPTCAQHSSSSR
jgi:hypothetical protein